jgi:hypothetical protein
MIQPAHQTSTVRSKSAFESPSKMWRIQVRGQLGRCWELSLLCASGTEWILRTSRSVFEAFWACANRPHRLSVGPVALERISGTHAAGVQSNWQMRNPFNSRIGIARRSAYHLVG